MYKLLLVLCAQALVQSISAQCIGAYNGLAYDGYGCGGCGGWAGDAYGTPIGGYFDSAWNVPFANGLGPAGLAASNGAGLAVTSASPITPTGVSMTSENAYEGLLAVTGAIPFLGVVALEGALPTIGAGAVTYGCGNGNVAILSEDIAPGFGYDGLAVAGFAGPFGYDGFAGPYGGALGYNGFAGPYGYGGCDGYAGPLGYDGFGYDGFGYGGLGGCAGPFY